MAGLSQRLSLLGYRLWVASAAGCAFSSDRLNDVVSRDARPAAASVVDGPRGRRAVGGDGAGLAWLWRRCIRTHRTRRRTIAVDDVSPAFTMNYRSNAPARGSEAGRSRMKSPDATLGRNMAKRGYVFANCLLRLKNPFADGHRLRPRRPQFITRWNTSDALVPPNPNELDSTVLIVSLRASCGTRSMAVST